MISFEPTDDERAIRDEVRRFAEVELRPQGRACEAGRGPTDAMRAAYAALGIAALERPEDAGGLGLSLAARALVEEELAWGDAGLACALDASGPAAAILLEMAAPEARAALLRSLSTPGDVTALALSEEDPAADAGLLLSTTATPDGAGGYVVHGRKRFVRHAPTATRFLVIARTPDGPAALLVDRAAKGVSVGREDDRVGLQALRSAEVSFEDVRLPGAARASPPEGAQEALERALARLWVTTAARQVGLARAALEYATFYAQDRSAFGKKIGQFQGIAFKLADMAIAVDAARWLVWRAACIHAKGAPEAPREAALALAQANEAAVKAAIDAVQVLGGAGFMEDYPAEKWMREARALASLDGSDGARSLLAAERLYGPGLERESGGPLQDPASSDEALAVMAALGRAFGAGGS